MPENRARRRDQVEDSRAGCGRPELLPIHLGPARGVLHGEAGHPVPPAAPPPLLLVSPTGDRGQLGHGTRRTVHELPGVGVGVGFGFGPPKDQSAGRWPDWKNKFCGTYATNLVYKYILFSRNSPRKKKTEEFSFSTAINKY